MSKYTPWFPGEIKPVRIGVYETGSDVEYQHWNGEFWGSVSGSIEGAEEIRKFRSIFQNDHWRGLAKPPKGQP